MVKRHAKSIIQDFLPKRLKNTNMRIGLIGYGKMGKEIEEIAISRGHIIAAKINSSNASDLYQLANKIDVAIEFSKPDLCFENTQALLDQKIPVVVGTTGWYQFLNDVKKKVEVNQSALLYSSNFSIGVNIFFELNRKLAAIMNNYPEYDILVNETHHLHKLDKPSGTAITIAEGILQNNTTKTDWELDSASGNALPIYSKREPDVVGYHEVKYISPIDEISISHNAFNRKGFALGAVVAAEWIINKTGFFTFKDLLNIK